MLERISRSFTTLVFTLVLGGIVYLPCSVASSSDSVAKWVPTGNLSIARYAHTATLLPNGKVLVVGGENNGNALDSAELYDPATGTWSVTGHLHAPHAGHTATLLPNGRVLVVGGVNIFDSHDNAELYDPATGIWSRTGGATTYRYDHTATLLRNGKVLVAGGASRGFAQTNVLYDPVTDTWSNTNGFLTPRIVHQATLLQDGRVLVTGGSSNANTSIGSASVEIFDPISGTWNSAARLNVAPQRHTATLLPDGKVLVAASDNVAELFDPSTGTWSHTGTRMADRMVSTASLLLNGKVLITGGFPARSDGTDPLLGSTELYDRGTGKWAYTSNLGTARFLHTATLLASGKVLVAGGAGIVRGEGDTVRDLNSAELFEGGYPQVALDGFTGSWFNPAQNGHGFALEVIPGAPSRLFASWFTFAPQGGQAWIVGLGPIDGNRAVLRGSQTVGGGGRFPPNFDAANVHQEDWGTLTFTFSDCNHGHVDWSSTVPGYGSGGMDLTRLTLPAGLTCSDDSSGMGYWDNY